MNSLAEELRARIRQVPDFPKPGINYFDITTLLKVPATFSKVIAAFEQRYADRKIDAIVAVEARGFLFGAPLALALDLPLVPVRKPGKLPAAVERVSYSLEYGEDSLELHSDALTPGAQVVLIDDLIATGGTVKAVIELLERLDAIVQECAFVVELGFLNPRKRLEGTELFSLVQYDEE